MLPAACLCCATIKSLDNTPYPTPSWPAYPASPPMLWPRPTPFPQQILGILAVGYVLEPLLTKVYMQNLIHAGEAVLASLRLELFRTLLMQKASRATGSSLGFGEEGRQRLCGKGAVLQQGSGAGGVGAPAPTPCDS